MDSVIFVIPGDVDAPLLAGECWWVRGVLWWCVGPIRTRQSQWGEACRGVRSEQSESVTPPATTTSVILSPPHHQDNNIQINVSRGGTKFASVPVWQCDCVTVWWCSPVIPDVGQTGHLGDLDRCWSLLAAEYLVLPPPPPPHTVYWPVSQPGCSLLNFN